MQIFFQDQLLKHAAMQYWLDSSLTYNHRNMIPVLGDSEKKKSILAAISKN
jgi:hypothetical protein